MIVIDHDDMILNWNSHAERIFGWSSADVIGQRLGSTIVPEVGRDAHTKGLARYKQVGKSAIFGTRLERDALCADGSTIRVELSVMRLDTDGGEVLICFLRDLTEELVAEATFRDLQSQLVHLSRTSAMSTMASTIAHELSQPLTAASQYLWTVERILSEELSGDITKAKQGVSLAAGAVTRAVETIRAVREMVGRGKLSRENHSLSALVSDSIRLLSGSLSTTPTVEISVDADCVFVNGVQIEQVLLNLIRNASEATSERPHPRLQVEALRQGGMIEVRVSDNGAGLPPDLAGLFSVAGSRKANGLGIGLSISRTIIENHGGTNWFERPPVGAQVCFTIPAG